MTMAVDTCQKPTYLLEIDSYFLTDFLMNIMDFTVRIILCAKEIIPSYNKTWHKRKVKPIEGSK